MLTIQLAARDSPHLIVDQREQLIEGPGVASAPGEEQTGDVGVALHLRYASRGVASPYNMNLLVLDGNWALFPGRMEQPLHDDADRGLRWSAFSRA
jgi:hypothetical protein